MSQERFEKPEAVEIVIDADGWPTVTIFPNLSDGKPARTLVLRPQGHAAWIEDRSHVNAIWSKENRE
jgi:hypothetical protein